MPSKGGTLGHRSEPSDFACHGFLLAGLSTAYVAWDQYRNNPEPAVMKWGFALITLYAISRTTRPTTMSSERVVVD